MRIPRFRQRSLLALRRRAGAALRRLVHNRFVTRKRVRLVEINGHRFKRLSLPDAASAREVARHLESFRQAGIFPELVAVIDAELLLEYVEGRPLDDPIDSSLIGRLAEFFATLYAAAPRRVRTADTVFGGELLRDLDFLRDVGIVAPDAHRDLAAAASALAPAEVWVGWDYLDPLPRNFVATHAGRLVAVDVEDLRPDQLLGSGVAKACLRSVGSRGAQLLAALERASDLDLAPAMPFVELHFLAEWTKTAFLKGRSGLVDPARFEPYRASGSTATTTPASSR